MNVKPHTIYGIENIEGAALSQFFDAMKQDYVVKGALMPDAHAGYALPIGAAVATEGVILPAWVGYDIGCGMCALPTTFNREAVEANKKAIFDQIYRDVPTGFDHNKTSTEWAYEGRVSEFVKQEIVAKGAPGKQIGTLGGGIPGRWNKTGKAWPSIGHVKLHLNMLRYDTTQPLPAECKNWEVVVLEVEESEAQKLEIEGLWK